jgi:arylsulfatase A-like enzyme
VSDLLGELRGRGRFDGSTIVLVGDHGQGLGQHGDPGHGRVWWEQLHVPFLLKPAARDVAADATPKSWPGDSTWRGTEVDALVSTIDVLPTAVAGTAGFDARPFLAQARGVDVLADGFESRPVFALAARQKKIAPADALLTERLQFVAGEEGEKLFDLASDERELRDAAAERPEVAARCRALLEKLRAEQQARRERLVRGEAAPIDAEAAARLRKELDALGYGGEGGAR